jgi:CBS domain containing-hemolysin-like protein
MALTIVILFCLILLSAVLSASETSLFSLSTFTLNTYRSHPDKRKKLIAKLLYYPRDLLVTILMLNVFANILIQNTVSSIFGTFSSWLLKVGIPLFLTLFFGELIPKSIALPNNKSFSYRLAPFIYYVSKIIKPVRVVITKLTSYVSRIMFFFLRKEKPLSIEELQHVIEQSEEKKILTRDETDLITGYLNLHDSNIKEHMRPRDEILYYDIHTSLEELICLFVDKQCARVPVCDTKIDNILGMISLKRFFLYKDKINCFKDLLEHLKKPYFVVETMKAWSLLMELRQIRENMALVVDEYGSISGLITQEDLTEQVLGKISSKKDENIKYSFSGKDEIIASGKMQIEELEDLFNVKLEKKSNAVTVGGFLIDEMGDIPKAGDKIEKDNLLFYVLGSDPNRVRKVYIRLLKSSKKKKIK